MATVNIRGVDLEYSAMSASFVRKTTDALNKMRDEVQASEEDSKNGLIDYATCLERSAYAFANLFDDIFGIGTASKMFGDVIDDVSVTADAIQAFIAFKEQQENAFADRAHSFGNKYSPSRVIRSSHLGEKPATMNPLVLPYRGGSGKA